MERDRLYVVSLSQVDMSRSGEVGGKNASLGELMGKFRDEGIRVPGGFATTASAYRDFIEAGGLARKIRQTIDQLRDGSLPLERAGQGIRRLFRRTPFPIALSRAISSAYRELGTESGGRLPAVAVRSSGVAEDLPEAGFAGQLESFLNVRGEEELLDACRRCFASLFTDRAIAYREDRGLDHLEVALSVGVQRMVRSDMGGAGAMFSMDTGSGFPDVVFINAAWGLGETVVQGAVDPDEYRVFKPLLKRQGLRPVIQRRMGGKARKMVYGAEGGKSTRLVDTGTAEAASFVLAEDEILQLARWAVAIEGHYGRPMGIEWARDGGTGELNIVQASPAAGPDQGTRGLEEGIEIVEAREPELAAVPATRTRVMMDLADPTVALRWWKLPSDGVGLARLESIVRDLNIHPLALTRFDRLQDREARRRIEAVTAGYADKTEYFVEHLADGIATMAAVVFPRPMLVRMSDFGTAEYAELVGGSEIEPREKNPMLGWRGASRYYSEDYRDGFALECQAVRRVREAIGLDNVELMIPFCRTTGEADRVLEALAANGLVRGEGGLKVHLMCQLPSNVVRAWAFAERFDGFAIDSDVLARLVLGVDPSSERVAGIFDERDEAVISMIGYLIRKAHEAGRTVGLCGRAPGEDPAFVRLLVRAGIDSISVSPDHFLTVKRHVADAETKERRPIQEASSSG